MRHPTILWFAQILAFWKLTVYRYVHCDFQCKKIYLLIFVDRFLESSKFREFKNESHLIEFSSPDIKKVMMKKMSDLVLFISGGCIWAYTSLCSSWLLKFGFDWTEYLISWLLRKLHNRWIYKSKILWKVDFYDWCRAGYSLRLPIAISLRLNQTFIFLADYC